MKYVIVQQLGCELPIIFDDILDHCCFSNLNAISAGVCRIIASDKPMDHDTSTITNDFEVDAYGDSTTLKISSRPEDAEIIRAFLLRPLR